MSSTGPGDKRKQDGAGRNSEVSNRPQKSAATDVAAGSRANDARVNQPARAPQVPVTVGLMDPPAVRLFDPREVEKKEVNAELKELLEKSGLPSLAAGLSANRFTTIKEVAALGSDNDSFKELVLVLNLDLRDKAMFKKMVKDLQGAEKKAKKSAGQKAKMAMEVLQSRFPHIKTKNKLLKPMPSDKQTNTGDTLLHDAANKGDVELAALCMDAGCTVDIENNSGWTPLYMSARSGHVKAVNLLIEANGDVNKTTKDNETPLHKAAWNGRDQVVARLMEAQCDVHKTTIFGRTALHYAAWNGHTAVVQRLLTARCDVNKPGNNGWTPLMTAVFNGHVETVRALLSRGADKTLKGKDGTALEMVRREKAIDVCDKKLEEFNKDGTRKQLEELLQ